MVNLDARLAAAAALVPHCGVFADIGSDHGLLAAYILQSGKAQRAILTDISADSLNKARRTVRAEGLTDRAAFYVADGFSGLPRADAAAVCGMGGREISRIVRRAGSGLPDVLVLLPHRNAFELRAALHDDGYAADADFIVREGRHFYRVMRAVRPKTPQPPPPHKELLLGKGLGGTMQDAAVYADFIACERRKTANNLIRAKGTPRAAALAQILELLEGEERLCPKT